MKKLLPVKIGQFAIIGLLSLLLCAAAWPQGAYSTAGGQATAVVFSASGAGSSEAGEEPEAEADLFAPDYTPQAEAVCLVNENSGLVVYEKNADAPMVSASLVKMMTCILAVESVQKAGQTLDEVLVDSTDKGWVYDALYGKNASTADIRKGEILSVRELLYAALLPSANEAALLLADYVSIGYIPNFIYMMNARATALGCTGTVFTDPNGLDEGNVTTARDMTKITRAFFSVPELAEIAAAASYEMAAHEKHDAPYFIHTTNRLLVPSSPYYNAFKKTAGCVVGGKTGSLGEWQNFASLATQDGMTYICAVLHSPNAADPIGADLSPAQARPALYESAALYNWAFAALEVRPALDVTQPVTEIRVKFSTQQGSVRLMPGDDVTALLPKEAGNDQIRRHYDLPEYLEAPVQAGDAVGSVTLVLAGQVLGSTQLYVEKDVARNGLLYALDGVGQFFTSLYLRVLVVTVLVAAALFVLVMFLLNRHKAQKKQRQAAAAQNASRLPRPAQQPQPTQRPRQQNVPPVQSQSRPPPARRPGRAAPPDDRRSGTR
ncbi:MAG: D-alanyl-D-alanine carboxypeptidase [Ruminococcaceae bacterium]|nr:D-alanyl-D-alanine carboxypeptidase [Oscillospiraceae bacterium]